MVVKPGTGKDKARYFDTVTFNYSAWDAEGRMFDSTEMRKRPATVPPFRQSRGDGGDPDLDDRGRSRARFWVAGEQDAAGRQAGPRDARGHV